MKKLFKYIGLSAFLLFAFYYTEKMSDIVTNNSKLVMEINDNSNNYNVESVSAIIDDNYIIPGLNGYTVNVLKSYDNMRHLDTFNSYYLEYDIVKPSISLDNNKEKIIKYGNSSKKMVSILINNNKEILEYIKTNKINVTRIVDINTFLSNALYEQINGDYNNYKKMELLLNKYNINKKICYINNYIKDICTNNKKYLVQASITLNNYNLINVKDNIKSGYIIYINDNVSLSDFKILLRQIYYQDLSIVSLSKLISEERD